MLQCMGKSKGRGVQYVLRILHSAQCCTENECNIYVRMYVLYCFQLSFKPPFEVKIDEAKTCTINIVYIYLWDRIQYFKVTKWLPTFCWFIETWCDNVVLWHLTFKNGTLHHKPFYILNPQWSRVSFIICKNSEDP